MPVPNSLACGCPAQAAEDRLGPATVFRSGGIDSCVNSARCWSRTSCCDAAAIRSWSPSNWPGQIRRVAPSWMAQSSATSSVPGRRSGGAVLPFPTRGRDLTSGSSISCTLGISNCRAWCQAYSRRFSAPAPVAHLQEADSLHVRLRHDRRGDHEASRTAAVEDQYGALGHICLSAEHRDGARRPQDAVDSFVPVRIMKSTV